MHWTAEKLALAGVLYRMMQTTAQARAGVIELRFIPHDPTSGDYLLAVPADSLDPRREALERLAAALNREVRSGRERAGQAH